MNFPSFNRSSREYHAPDVYAESQALTDRKDDYEGAQAANRPETYRDKYRAVYRLIKAYRLAFPFLSGVTLGLLAFLLTLGFEALTGQLQGKALAIGILGFVGLVVVVWINETVKARTLKATFKAVCLKRDAEPGTKFLAALTTLLSLVGSAAGIALLTYELNDQSQAITQGHTVQVQAITSTYAADSLNIAGEYNLLIADARQAISDNRDKVKRLMAEKIKYRGEMVTPWKNREIAAKLEQENARLSGQIAKWQADKIEKLEDSRLRADKGQSQASEQLTHQLTENEENAFSQSWIAFAALVLLELVNLFAHYFGWVYLSRVEREGIEFGALSASAEKTAYEIQLSRLTAYLQQAAHANGLQLPGYAPGGTVAPSPPLAERAKAGFKLPWEQHSQNPLNSPETGFKGGLNGGTNTGANEADFAHLDPTAAAEIAGYLEKYKPVVQAVMEGKSNKQVSSSCSVSVSTVHNVKRCMRVVKLIPEK